MSKIIRFRKPFLTHLWQGMMLVVLASILTAKMHPGWIVKPLEATNLSSFFHLASADPTDRIIVVEINSDDFSRQFGGISPLKRETVLNLLKIIDAG